MTSISLSVVTPTAYTENESFVLCLLYQSTRTGFQPYNGCNQGPRKHKDSIYFIQINIYSNWSLVSFIIRLAAWLPIRFDLVFKYWSYILLSETESVQYAKPALDNIFLQDKPIPHPVPYTLIVHIY